MLGAEGLLAADFQIRDGKLYCFRREALEMIRPWGADAGAWRFHAGSGWQAFTPDLRIERLEEAVSRHERIPRLPPRQRRRLEAYRFLLESWPAKAKDCVRPFTSSHWELLQLANRGGERAVQLLTSNPALAYLLATSESVAPEGVQALLAARRRRIAARFGFPEAELAVRLLGKIPAEWVSPELLRTLRELLAGGAVACEALEHLPRISAAALGVLGRPEFQQVVSLECLRQICEMGPQVPHFDVVARVDALLDAAQREGRGPVRINRLRDIDRLRLRPAPQRPRPAPARPRRRAAVPRTFPPPPVPEGCHIQAIRTPEDLRAEGRLMGHCAARYARSVATGTLFFYRMLEPERATICLRKHGDGWDLDEVRGPNNRRARASTRSRIVDWLSRHRMRVELEAA